MSLETVKNQLLLDNQACSGIVGELSAKTAAKSYWKKELEQELDDLSIREKWSFSKVKGLERLEGSEEDAMDFIETKRSNELYNHNCSKRCQDKGLSYIEKARKLCPTKGYAGTIRIKTNYVPIMALDRI